MTDKRIAVAAVLGCIITTLTACGGGGGGNGNSSTGGGNVPVGGIYNGSITESGQTYTLMGIVDEIGNATFVESNSTAPVALVTPGTEITSANGSYNSGPNAAAYALCCTGFTFSNGQSTERVAISATIDPRTSINGTFTDAGGSGTFTLTYDAAHYQQASSLSLIAGTYAYSYGGATGTITIASNGTVSGSDNQGRVYSGTVTVQNAAYNAYDVLITQTNANPALGSYSGLAAYYPAAGGRSAELHVAMNNGSSAFYAVLTAQ